MRCVHAPVHARPSAGKLHCWRRDSADLLGPAKGSAHGVDSAGGSVKAGGRAAARVVVDEVGLVDRHCYLRAGEAGLSGPVCSTQGVVNAGILYPGKSASSTPRCTRSTSSMASSGHAVRQVCAAGILQPAILVQARNVLLTCSWRMGFPAWRFQTRNTRLITFQRQKIESIFNQAW